VAPDVWVLERADHAPATEDAFQWERLVAAGAGPSGRSRPALGFNVDADVLVIAGGDTTGSAVPGGQTDAIWTMIGRYYGNPITWHSPLVRSFHPAPPPIAGMGMVALGAG